MKKLATIFMLFGAFSAFGQSDGIEFGVKCGWTYNLNELGVEEAVNASGEIFSGERSRNGWHLGLSARDEITDNFYVHLDALFNQTEYVVLEDQVGGGYVEHNIPLQSIQVNLMPGFKMFNFVRIQAGLNGNIGVNQEYNDAYGQYGVGYQLGVGADLGPLTFDIGYNASFNSTEGEWNGVPLTSNRGGLLMSVGLLF